MGIHLAGEVHTPHIFNTTLRAINFTSLSDISPHCDNSWRKKYHLCILKMKQKYFCGIF